MDSNTPSSSSDSVEIDIEQTAWVAEILRNRRRIQILIELDSADEDGLTVGELADRIAERDHGQHYEAEERKRIYIALYQTQIQTLEAGDVLAVNRDACTRGRRFGEVVSALARLQT